MISKDLELDYEDDWSIKEIIVEEVETPQGV
jgi:hypothetical protein